MDADEGTRSTPGCGDGITVDHGEIALPSISIVVPTHDRPQQLERCVRALAALDYARSRYEVIVVDDGDVLRALSARDYGDLSLTIVGQPRGGPASARNAGVARASGTCVAFVDDDCVPATDWLRRLASRLVATPGALIGGRTSNALPGSLCSSASQLLVDYLIDCHPAGAAGFGGFFPSCNLAVSRDRFVEVGGFDTTFPLAAAEDREFCDRWVAHGYELVFADEAVVHHAHPLTLRGFSRQHFDYGRGAYRLHRLRAGLGGRLAPEPLRFYRDLLAWPFTQLDGAMPLRISALLAVSQVANAAGFVSEAVRATVLEESREARPVPIASP